MWGRVKFVSRIGLNDSLFQEKAYVSLHVGKHVKDKIWVGNIMQVFDGDSDVRADPL